MVKQKYEMNNPNLKIPLKGLSSNNNIIYYDKKLFYENSRNSTFDNEINQKSLKIKNISGITSRSSREFKLTGIKNKEMDNEENIKKEIDYDIKKTYRKDSKKIKNYVINEEKIGDIDLSHPNYFCPQNLSAKLQGNNCNVNYNIKKNIINLNINPDDGNSSIYEHENNEFSEDKKMKKYYDKLNDDNIQENYNNYKHKKKNSNKSLTHKNNYYKDLEEERSINSNSTLTNKVWPKSRTFLSIISKMFNECLINENQRGILKEMIMDHNKVLNNILDEYEIDADSKKLYENIIQLANTSDKNNKNHIKNNSKGNDLI